MSESYGILLFLISAVLSLLALAGVIYFIFFLFKNKEKGIKITTDSLLKIYLYVITFVTLFIAIGGASVAVSSALSYKLGIPFSYKLTPVNEYFKESAVQPTDPTYMGPECYIGEKIVIEDQKVCFDKNIQKQSLINGITIAISMIVLFGIHRFGIYLSEKKSTMEWLKKTYTFVSLVVFSLAGIVTLPISLYQLTTYIFSRPENITLIDPPGLSVSLILFILPFWIFFLISTIKLKEEK